MYSASNGSLGKYNPEDRRREIHGRLEKELEAARMRIAKAMNTSDKESESKSNGNGDLLKMEVERFVEEVKVFEKEVEEFEGPHFTKQYRALINKSQIFQEELDKLDLAQRDDVKAERRALLNQIEFIVRQLKTKLHADGKPCEDCKVSKL